MRISVVVLNEDVVGARLRLYGEKFDHKEPLWADIALGFASANEFWFETQGEGTWPPLKDPKDKEYRAPGRPMLVRTGALKDSLTDPTRLIQSISDPHVVLGTDIFYAEFHMTGTEDMHQRRPIVPTRDIRQIAKDAAEDFAEYDH